MTFKDSLLYTLIALLVVAVGYLLFLQYRAPATSYSETPTSQTNTHPQSDIVIGGGGPEVYFVHGQVTEVSASSISVKELVNAVETGKVVKFAVGSKTRVTTEGNLKDPKVYQQEMAVYNAKVQELEKNAEANKQELANLTVPSPEQDVVIAISAIHADDYVDITANIGDTASVKTAETILLIKPK